MLKSLLTFAEKKMKELDKKRWVKTADVVEFLKSDPDHEHEFSRHLGGMLRSTYWMKYKSDKNMFALSRDWIRPDYYTEEELLQCYEGHWWNLTC